MPRVEPAAESLVDAQSALATSSFPAIRKLKVTETRRTLIISGTVASYYCKQLAQEAVRRFSDGRRVINRICVEK